MASKFRGKGCGFKIDVKIYGAEESLKRAHRTENILKPHCQNPKRKREIFCGLGKFQCSRLKIKFKQAIITIK